MIAMPIIELAPVWTSLPNSTSTVYTGYFCIKQSSNINKWIYFDSNLKAKYTDVLADAAKFKYDTATYAYAITTEINGVTYYLYAGTPTDTITNGTYDLTLSSTVQSTDKNIISIYSSGSGSSKFRKNVWILGTPGLITLTRTGSVTGVTVSSDVIRVSITSSTSGTTNLYIVCGTNDLGPVTNFYKIESTDCIFEKRSSNTSLLYPSVKVYNGDFSSLPGSYYNGVNVTLTNNTSSAFSNSSKNLVINDSSSTLVGASTPASGGVTNKIHTAKIYKGLVDVLFQTNVTINNGGLTFILNVYKDNTLIDTKTINYETCGQTNPSTTTLTKLRSIYIVNDNDDYVTDANNNIILNVTYDAPDTDTRVWSFYLTTVQ